MEKNGGSGSSNSNKVTQQIVFAKLCSLSHDMLSFEGLAVKERDKIKDLVTLFARSYKLPRDDLDELLLKIDKYG